MTAGVACERGQVCADGVCGLSCPPGFVNCDGTCFDPRSSPDHCGAVPGCSTMAEDADPASVGATCSRGTVCANGTCALSCPPGLVECRGVCVDPTSNRTYCGATEGCGATGGNAGATCAGGSVCANGACDVACQNGFVNCNGTCIDPSTSRTHCGAGGTCNGDAGAAGTACNSGEVCSGGTCGVTCQGGFVNCGGTCVDPNASRAYCGATLGCGAGGMGSVGTACDPGQLCSMGSCLLSCSANLVQCGTVCVDPSSNRAHCGATMGCGAGAGNAGAVCDAGFVCAGGACSLTCPANLVKCGTSCFDPQSNAAHCGATLGCGAGMGSAGATCSFGDVCLAGTCTPILNTYGPPITAGLVAHYTSRDLSTLTMNGANVLSQWADRSGNGHTLVPNGTGPVYAMNLINGRPALDFGGGKGMITPAAFALTSEVTVFFATQYRTPGGWGAWAHHGDRDSDWALEQNNASPFGLTGTHFQSVNDNAGVELQLAFGTDYVLVGRITGNQRYYGATSTPGTAQTSGGGVSIGPGVKTLYVGRSNNSEPINAYIGEFLYYNRSLSDGERDTVLAWLRSAWGI